MSFLQFTLIFVIRIHAFDEVEAETIWKLFNALRITYTIWWSIVVWMRYKCILRKHKKDIHSILTKSKERANRRNRIYCIIHLYRRDGKKKSFGYQNIGLWLLCSVVVVVFGEHIFSLCSWYCSECLCVCMHACITFCLRLLNLTLNFQIKRNIAFTQVIKLEWKTHNVQCSFVYFLIDIQTECIAFNINISPIHAWILWPFFDFLPSSFLFFSLSVCERKTTIIR